MVNFGKNETDLCGQRSERVKLMFKFRIGLVSM